MVFKIYITNSELKVSSLAILLMIGRLFFTCMNEKDLLIEFQRKQNFLGWSLKSEAQKDRFILDKTKRIGLSKSVCSSKMVSIFYTQPQKKRTTKIFNIIFLGFFLQWNCLCTIDCWQENRLKTKNHSSVSYWSVGNSLYHF